MNTSIVHILAFRRLEEGSEEAFEKALKAIRGLVRLDGVEEVVAGPDVSVEGRQGEFTHIIMVRFASSSARQSYFTDRRHVDAANLLLPLIDDLVVLDVAHPRPTDG